MVHNIDDREVRFARSARRHRVGRARALEALASPASVRELARDHRGAKLLVLGADRTGRVFEIVAIALPGDVLLVIHVMDLRSKYRAEYERGG